MKLLSPHRLSRVGRRLVQQSGDLHVCSDACTCDDGDTCTGGPCGDDDLVVLVHQRNTARAARVACGDTCDAICNGSNCDLSVGPNASLFCNAGTCAFTCKCACTVTGAGSATVTCDGSATMDTTGQGCH